MSTLKKAFYNYKTLLLHTHPISLFGYMLRNDKHLWKILLAVCVADVVTWTLLLASVL